MSARQSPAGRPARPAPADYDRQARALVDGYISALCGSRALKAGLRKALAKLQSSISK